MGFECGFEKIITHNGDTPKSAIVATLYWEYRDYLRYTNQSMDDVLFSSYTDGAYNDGDLPSDIEPYRPQATDSNDTSYRWCSIGRVLDDIVVNTFHWKNQGSLLYMSAPNLQKLKEALSDKIISNLPTPVYIRSAVRYKYDEETDEEETILRPLDGVAVTSYGIDGDFSSIIDVRDNYEYSTNLYALLGGIDGEEFDALVSFIKAVDDIIERTKNGEEFLYYRSC